MTDEKRYPSMNWPATEIKDLKDRIIELEAARDHLRAQLQQLVERWTNEAEAGDTEEEAFKSECAADLLAILTERPQEEKQDG